MGFLKEQWNKYKAKSTWGKVSDVLYILFFIAILTPSGRMAFQRALLEIGLFSSTELNEDVTLSEGSLNLKLTDMNGNTVTLSDMKGKVVFLNFWSTWCAPCTAEMPSILSLREKTDENVVFILAAHEAAPTIKKYMEKKEWDMPAYMYNTTPGEELRFGSLPTTFIIDRNGKVVHRSSGIKKWDTEGTINLLNELAGAEM